MLLQRTKKPLQITAGKFCAFSLQTFAEVTTLSIIYTNHFLSRSFSNIIFILSGNKKISQLFVRIINSESENTST